MTQCEIIRDLLPLYHDNACSGASRAAVEAHIETCGACRAILTEMDAPLPLPPAPAPPHASRMREAKRRLTQRVALAVIAVVTAMALLVAGGAALYTEFEAVRYLPYTDRLVEAVLQNEGVTEIHLNLKRYDSVQCLFRRVTVDGEARDVVCLMLEQTGTRKYLDWSVEGPEMIALGAGTGLAVSRGGLRYEAYYGYEYEPELWNPGWAYPGHVSAIYYWDYYTSFPLKTDWPEEDFLQTLQRNGILLWKEGD